MEVTDIEHGSNVYGADDEKGGDVSEVQDTYIVVSKGLFFPSERSIPTSAITRVEHDHVYRNLTKDEVKAHDWDRVPETGTLSGTAAERRERTTESVPRREGGAREECEQDLDSQQGGVVGSRTDPHPASRTRPMSATTGGLAWRPA